MEIGNAYSDSYQSSNQILFLHLSIWFECAIPYMHFSKRGYICTSIQKGDDHSVP